MVSAQSPVPLSRSKQTSTAITFQADGCSGCHLCQPVRRFPPPISGMVLSVQTVTNLYRGHWKMTSLEDMAEWICTDGVSCHSLRQVLDVGMVLHSVLSQKTSFVIGVRSSHSFRTWLCSTLSLQTCLLKGTGRNGQCCAEDFVF